MAKEKATGLKLDRSHSLWEDAFIRLRRNKLAIAGLIYLVLIVILCTKAHWFTKFSYETINLELGATPPSNVHWFGTDDLGRDLFSRVLYGGRISLMVGLCATLVSLLIGVSYGIISGYCGGMTDKIMMRAVEIMYALPFTIFVILLMVMFGRNLILIFVAIGAIEWLTMARIVRGQVLSLKVQEFVLAAKVLGQSSKNVMLKHLLPNLLGTIIVYATLTIPGVMLLESFLSFLGLGVQAPMTSWGSLINEGAVVMEDYPWAIIFPSVIFSLTLFSLNFLGDGLRDALDPREAR